LGRWPLNTWNKSAWKSLFVPGGMVLFVTVILMTTGWVTLTLPVLTFLYYGGVLAGLLLAWRFHSSRVFFALLVLLLAQQALGFLLPGTAPLKGPGHVALEATIFLVPVNFVLLSLARERGFTVATVGSTLIFLFLQSMVVAALARAAQDYPALLHTQRHAPVSLLSSPYVWAAFAIGSVLMLVRFMLFRKPAEAALAWSLTSFFLALNSGGIGRIATAYFAASALILALCIIEISYLLAYHDELTALLSRRAFKDALLRIHAPYSIAIVDIDHFKRFNDTYGHDIGDEVLRLVASSLARVGGGGRAYRCGGEEFAIVFPGKASSEVVDHLEPLRATIESSSFRIRGTDRRELRRGPDRRTEHKRSRARTGRTIRQLLKAEIPSVLSVTVSIGVAACTQEETDPERIVQAADKALYRAKADGRNRVETSSLPRRRVRSKTAGIA
jgi:diguanylate cyclase (GGDEF)-like protein